MATSTARQQPAIPLHYHVPLFPGFQLLDLAGPLDILNIRAQYPETAGITLTLLSDTLDPVSVKPVPPPDATWRFDLPSGPPTNTACNQKIVPDITFRDYLTALEEGHVADDGSKRHKPIDVLLIPGGPGMRLDRIIEPGSQRASNTQEMQNYICAVAPHIRHSIITICTGAGILAKTGLLNERSATTNSARFHDITTADHKHNDKVLWQAHKRWVRSDAPQTEATDHPQQNTTTGSGRDTRTALHQWVDIWSSAGITAGIDVMLEFVKAHYGGVDIARATAKRLEYRWEETDDGRHFIRTDT